MDQRLGNCARFLVVLGTVSAPALASAQDSDGDGVANTIDSHPCDAAISAVAFAPAEGVPGSLLFEDRWPSQGDLDFNDLAVGYNYVLRMNAAGKVKSITATFDAVAVGGTLNNGLGLVLPVQRTAVQSVTRSIAGGGTQAITPSATDPSLTLVLSSNVRELFGGAAGAINARGDSDRRDGARLVVEIVFTQPVTLATNAAPYDVYIFRSEDPSHQIHRPEFAGTAAMKTALFRTLNDASTDTRHFVDEDGLPFALSFPTLVDYPAEETEVSILFPRILSFASSGGAQARDFYLTGVNATASYRDRGGRGRFTPPAPVAPAADRACLPALAFTPNVNTGRTGTIQTYTVPATGRYSIEAWGAQGGNTSYYSWLPDIEGCKGARMKGTFTLNAGATLSILVGKVGTRAWVSGKPGGGGGSYVFSGSTLYLAAAGGGGAGTESVCSGGSTQQNGRAAQDGGSGIPGGTNGQGGPDPKTGPTPWAYTYAGGGGAGWLADGGDSTYNGLVEGGYHPRSTTCPGCGGSNPSGFSQPNGEGGFGGGGAGLTGGGGGGGGYSGGAGGRRTSSNSEAHGGGGGGSYNAGTDPSNTEAVQVGAGRVEIKFLGS